MKKSTINYLSGDRRILFGYRDEHTAWVGSEYFLVAVPWEEFLKLGKIAIYATSHYEEFKASEGYIKEEDGSIKPLSIKRFFPKSTELKLKLSAWKLYFAASGGLLQVFLTEDYNNIFVGEKYLEYALDCLGSFEHPNFCTEGAYKPVVMYDDDYNELGLLLPVRIRLDEKVSRYE